VKNLCFLRYSAISIGFALLAHFSYAQVALVVTSPAVGEQMSSPVNFTAAATSQDCSPALTPCGFIPRRETEHIRFFPMR